MLQSSLVFDGGAPSYSGEMPTRDKTAVGTTVTKYSFKGWDKPLTGVSAPTVFTAVYNTTTFTGYRVDFFNADGSALYGDYFEQGTKALCPQNLLPWSCDNENVTIFVGWDTSVSNLSSAVRTKAITRTIARSQNGEWPQTQETDNDIIDVLNDLKPDSDGFYHYGTNKYAREDGSTWRKVEPIRWRFLSSDGNDVFVVSEKALTRRRYNEKYDGLKNGFYANNYKNSEIRSWLNGEFLNQALPDDSLVATTVVDNSPASTLYPDNSYACENTNDKIFLLSYAEVRNVEYGFKDDFYDLNRKCENVDGIDVDWWLRSPSPSGEAFMVSSWDWDRCNVGDYQTDFGYAYVRPALHFHFD